MALVNAGVITEMREWMKAVSCDNKNDHGVCFLWDYQFIQLHFAANQKQLVKSYSAGLWGRSSPIMMKIWWSSHKPFSRNLIGSRQQCCGDIFRPEAANDFIFSQTVDYVSVVLCVKFNGSTLSHSQDIQLPHFVMDEWWWRCRPMQVITSGWKADAIWLPSTKSEIILTSFGHHCA